MKHRILYTNLILSIVSVAFLSSCNHTNSTNTAAADTSITSEVEEPLDSMTATPFDGEPLPESDYSKNYDEIAAQEAELAQKANTSQNKSANNANAGRTEKLYISTYGAQGQVWGYVTMHGNKGRGTIHDADENTLSITVTRHGNELFGTDQNGREYVFKI